MLKEIFTLSSIVMSANKGKDKAFLTFRETNAIFQWTVSRIIVSGFVG